MPRTKRPAKIQDKVVEDDDRIKRLKKLSNGLKMKIDSQAQMQMGHVEIAFKILLSSMSVDYLQKTVGQLRTELHLEEAMSTRQTASSSTMSNDDAPPSAGRTLRRSRSADPSARSVAKPRPRATSQLRRSKSVYRTPAYNKASSINYPVITPKVTPQAPLTLLRQVRQGEMVVSMSGSPVMVPTYANATQPDEKASCLIQLRDGTMLSLRPKLLRQSQAYIPFSLMDDNVLDQLNTLQENLNKVVKLGQGTK